MDGKTGRAEQTERRHEERRAIARGEGTPRTLSSTKQEPSLDCMRAKCSPWSSSCSKCWVAISGRYRTID